METLSGNEEETEPEKQRDSYCSFWVGLTPTVFYIPGFITDQEQTQLLNRIYGASGFKWKTLKNRRLQNWGVLLEDFHTLRGMVHEKGLVPQEWDNEQNRELEVETTITGILATESDITRCELGKDERIYW
ncbi:hypothetical protein Bca101_094317 [Brassica carinata]